MTKTDDDTTASAATRWEFTNDVVGAGYLVAFVVIVAGNAADLLGLAQVPIEVRAVWLTIAGVIATWMFGVAALKAWTSLRAQ